MWTSEPNASWDGAGFGYNVYNDGGTPNAFGRANTNFGQAYMRMVSSGNWYFYTTNTSGTRYSNMELTPNGNVWMPNVLEVAGSSRSAIFYDIANTGYYLDPASTSNLNALSLAGQLVARTPISSTTTTDTYGNSSIRTESHGVAQSDSAYYPMITGYTVVNGSGYVNMPSFGYMRTTGGINGEVIIKNSGDGLGILYWRFRANGDFVAPGDIIAYSDARVKDNVENISDALAKVRAIRGVTFTRSDASEGYENDRHMGVIAQELLEIVPEVVTGTEETKYSVAYGNLAGLFIEAIKEQQTQIENQQSQIDELKALVKRLVG
jgi:hypothetical protein